MHAGELLPFLAVKVFLPPYGLRFQDEFCQNAKKLVRLKAL